MTVQICASALALLLGAGAIAAPPATPVITEPDADGLTLNPADVHMETAPFSDPDGDGHFCTDWELRELPSNTLVWSGVCVTGPEAIHAHFGDGVFQGPLAGATALAFSTDYLLRVRHRDNSAGQEFSAWRERTLTTGAPTAIFPLETDDILETPAPVWQDETGTPVVLASAPTQPSLSVEHAASGELLLEIAGLDGASNQVLNTAQTPTHDPIRIRVSAGSLASELLLPESELRFTDDNGEAVTIYLPAMVVASGDDAFYWVTDAGATYVGASGQTTPNFSTLARSLPVPWVASDGYRVDVVASGLQLPVNIAFVPNPGTGPTDPLYYVTELYGTIKVVRNDGVVGDYVTGLLNFDPTGFFPGSGEQGVTGIAVDPTTGDVFAGYLYEAPGGAHYPRVSRFSSVDGGLTSNNETAILDMFGESQGQSHQISNITVGPDGALYVHMGDGFVASTAQDLNSFRGKILRMNLDGSAPSDNPFFNAGNGISATDYVYAYGVRNPFGGEWRDADGRLYEVENGPSRDRIVQVVPGRNYLWDGSNGSMNNFALHLWNPATGPVNCAFIQASNFGGSGFPTDKTDHLFVSESGGTYAAGPQSRGKQITEFTLDAAGNITSGPTPLISYAGVGRATVVGLAAGPDGLYFTDLYKDISNNPIERGANVLRVSFVGAAGFDADFTSGEAPLTVQFTDESTTPNIVSYQWSFGDGGTSSDANPSHTYTSEGLFDVSLTVTSDSGVRIEQKVGYIRVGVAPSVGLVGGGLPPVGADQAIADHLSSLGYEVTFYDDEPGNRPSAAQLGDAHSMVILSSTVVSGNIGGEFRTVDVPVIFWEQALLTGDRMAFATEGTVEFGQTDIEIVDNTHPITEGLSLGTLQMFNAPSNMSLANAGIASNAEVLARRPSAPTTGAIVVADGNDPLLGGHVPPERRVFIAFEDSSFASVTADGRDLLDRSSCWAMGLTPPLVLADPADTTVATGGTIMLTVGAQGASPLSYRWRRNGQLLPNSGVAMLVIENAGESDAGLYEVEISNACGSVTSLSAMVTVGCAADFDGSGVVDILDLLEYLTVWFPGDPQAERTGDGMVTVLDLLDFLSVWFGGC